MSASIASVASALPARIDQLELWDGFFADHFAHDRRARAAWRGSRIATRHSVADPRVEDLRWWGTEARVRRFHEEAGPLAKESSSRALEKAGLRPEDIDALTVVSCTGYANPGLDATLARDLGLPASVRRTFVGHMGCFAAVPALSLAADAASARGATTLVVCAELPSLHIQPPTEEIDQVVAHALFSDAVAALVVTPGPGALGLIGFASITVPAAADLMAWDVTDSGFRMRLSPEVPRAVAPHVEPLAEALLTANEGMSIQDVAAWAVHPGGPRILEVVASRLGVSPDLMAASHAVLSDSGNCSSATLPLIIERILEDPPSPGGPVVGMAFGPGLTLTGALMRIGTG